MTNRLSQHILSRQVMSHMVSMVKRSSLMACAGVVLVSLPLMACPQRGETRVQGEGETPVLAQTNPSVDTPDGAVPNETQVRRYESRIYSGATSPSSVAIIEDLPLTDASRNRDIPLRIYYPQEAGIYPVVLFSHGAGGSNQSFEHLGRFWAANGYVAIHLTHPGTDAATFEAGGGEAIRTNASDPQSWIDRAEDVAFVLASLDDIEAREPALAGKLDRNAIAMAGHSMGAYTTMLTAGTTVDTGGRQREDLAVPGISAFIAISPQGPGILGLRRDSWATTQGPMLVITGTNDEGQRGQDANWRIQAYDSLPAGDKYLAVIDGAEHSSYGDGGETDREGERMKAFVRVTTLTFLDAYIRGDEEALALLQSPDEFPSRTEQRVAWERK